jgi:hypothetical protein
MDTSSLFLASKAGEQLRNGLSERAHGSALARLDAPGKLPRRSLTDANPTSLPRRRIHPFQFLDPVLNQLPSVLRAEQLTHRARRRCQVLLGHGHKAGVASNAIFGRCVTQVSSPYRIAAAAWIQVSWVFHLESAWIL